MKHLTGLPFPYSLALAITSLACMSAAGCGYTDDELDDSVRASSAAVERGAGEDTEPSERAEDERAEGETAAEVRPDAERADGRSEERPEERSEERSEDDVTAGGWPVGAYRGYLCDPSLTDDGSGLFIATDGISRSEAFDNCTLTAAANPELTLWCTWNDELIYDDCGRDAEERGDEPALCGLFRGGLSEAEHMIASPNPASSIDDTDAACAEYCQASGMQPGDLCVRGGSVVAVASSESGEEPR